MVGTSVVLVVVRLLVVLLLVVLVFVCAEFECRPMTRGDEDRPVPLVAAHLDDTVVDFPLGVVVVIRGLPVAVGECECHSSDCHVSGQVKPRCTPPRRPRAPTGRCCRPARPLRCGTPPCRAPSARSASSASRRETPAW